MQGNQEASMLDPKASKRCPLHRKDTKLHVFCKASIYVSRTIRLHDYITLICLSVLIHSCFLECHITWWCRPPRLPFSMRPVFNLFTKVRYEPQPRPGHKGITKLFPNPTLLLLLFCDGYLISINIIVCPNDVIRFATFASGQ